MIRSLIQNKLSKAGKSYQIDEQIPDALLRKFLFLRLILMARGIFKTYQKVYVGRHCEFWNLRNIHFGKNNTIENHTLIDGFAQNGVRFGNNVKIGAYSQISCTSHLSKYGKGIRIGNNCAVGRFAEFGAAGGIEIGNDVIMGSYVSFHSENHLFENKDVPIREQGVSSKGIKLGNDIWVGAKVTFLDGTIIGNHCVVAAGAVVNGQFPDHCVIGGVPAKIIKNLNS
jgi:acetyltransferase-like isoleucine patch superfamily enzyme